MEAPRFNARVIDVNWFEQAILNNKLVSDLIETIAYKLAGYSSLRPSVLYQSFDTYYRPMLKMAEIDINDANYILSKCCDGLSTIAIAEEKIPRKLEKILNISQSLIVGDMNLFKRLLSIQDILDYCSHYSTQDCRMLEPGTIVYLVYEALIPIIIDIRELVGMIQ